MLTKVRTGAGVDEGFFLSFRLFLYHMSVGVDFILHLRKRAGDEEKNQEEVTKHILLKESVSSLLILLRCLNLATSRPSSF